ncbi:hypothetical protein B0H13DRAFT_1867617 [Mycena leptocephala]|nr:hypothetical protein B0H13DRAFT_1867617 [Mycena leptocephala]
MSSKTPSGGQPIRSMTQRDTPVTRRVKIADTTYWTRRRIVQAVDNEAEILGANLKRELVSLSEMDALTVPKIVDQLNSYRARGVPDILKISNYRLKADKLQALKKAFEWYQVHKASLPVPVLGPESIELIPEIVEEWVVEEDIEMED